MWNKSEAGSEPAQSAVSSERSVSTGGRATIGPSISIRGTLVGGEDLVVEGKLEGEISVEKHSVTVGQKGRVKADVYGKAVCVEGEVQGNIYGKEQVVIKQSGRVIGNVTSPRVSLENGSHFRGNIDMQPVTESSSASQGSKKNDKRGNRDKEEQRDKQRVAAGSG